MKKLMLAAVAWFLVGATSAQAQEVIRLYGPGGPAPAMKEAATTFGKKAGVQIEITAGPSSQWVDRAKKDADIIYSGSETMMTDLVFALEGIISHTDVRPLYLRPLSMLVRPGNPRAIKGFNDLLRPDVKILVVNGAGQSGVWEDMAGRKGDIGTVRTIRGNIAAFAKSSAEARQMWMERQDIDVWLIWNIWQVANRELAETVPLEPEYRIYRDTGIALTLQGKGKPAARGFADFLASPEGAKIFRKWGWITP
ncbi:substrate-binding domain-containing protein [Geobacter sp. DSM 9736]|uniref:substrate-binding domain-containing protein n=1 Tax=Geobacter sp. DSM 9736 TaxID=1277350 RepID=UPI000B512C9F|nr:substrate-binding domain-containing protein [Geobacter sp. DSM 9736]SNB47247.1 accessory colonization factor AcfC [Geobacter sp. DSM 9736]